MDYSFYSFYCLDSLEIRLDHNSTYYRSLSKNSDVKARISHCDSQNLQYKTHPEFWPSHRRIFKTSLYYKTRLILETRRYTFTYNVHMHIYMHIHTHIHTGAYLRHWCLVGAMSSHRCQSTMAWHVASSRFYIYKEYIPIWRHWTGILICFI